MPLAISSFFGWLLRKFCRVLRSHFKPAQVLTNLGLLGYTLRNWWTVCAAIAFALTYSVNATVSFLIDDIRCSIHRQCFDFLYFSVPIFFNIANFIAAGLALLSALAQLRTTTSTRGSTTQRLQLDNLNPPPTILC